MVSRLYYDEARWGYSAGVSAFELVNEYPSTAAVNLSTFLTGKTVTQSNGTTVNVRGVNAWLSDYNTTSDPNQDSHLITSSCSANMPPPECDPLDQVEIRAYQPLTPAITAIQSAFQEANWACNPSQPCLWAEYGMSNNTPPDPHSWVAHKGVWSALATNHTGAWYGTPRRISTPCPTPALTLRSLGSGHFDRHRDLGSVDR